MINLSCLLALAVVVQGQRYGGSWQQLPYSGGYSPATSYGHGETFIYGNGYKKGPVSSGYGLHSTLPGVYALKHSGPRAPVYGDNYRYKYGYNWPARYVYPGHAKRFFLSRGDVKSSGKIVKRQTTEYEPEPAEYRPAPPTPVYGPAEEYPTTYSPAPVSDTYGPVSDTYGPATATYGPVSDTYGPAPATYGPASDSYSPVYGPAIGYGLPVTGYGYKSSGPVIVNTNKVPVYGGHSWAGVYQGYGVNAPKSPYGVLVSGNLYPTYVYKNVGYGRNAGNFGPAGYGGYATGVAPVYGGEAVHYGTESYGVPSYGTPPATEYVTPSYGTPTATDYGTPSYGTPTPSYGNPPTHYGSEGSQPASHY